MSKLPPITVSSEDHEQLYRLLGRSSDPKVAGMGLWDELDRATVLVPEEMPENVVRMHSRARFRVGETGREFTAELVYPHQKQGDPDKVSIFSPAGEALLGLATGDSIEWPMAGGKKLHIELLEVL